MAVALGRFGVRYLQMCRGFWAKKQYFVGCDSYYFIKATAIQNIDPFGIDSLIGL